MISSILIFRSVIFIPLCLQISITEFRVIPGSIAPSSSGVITSLFITNETFIAPISEAYFISFASNHNTCEKPFFSASVDAFSEAA